MRAVEKQKHSDFKRSEQCYQGQRTYPPERILNAKQQFGIVIQNPFRRY